jgi:dTDP-4-amino-4,6-dideoxygalactose transaminase
MNVPFLDLKAQHQSIRAELDAAIGKVMDSCAFAGGPFVEKFEEEFAHFCGAHHSIGVGNGTDALWLILLALGIGPGDEVVTVPNSFIATAEAISFTGATPVFVDVDPSTYTMDPGCLEAAISDRTRAVIPVHLFGQTADMDPIMAIAGTHGIPVVEDACQAHGAEYRGRKAGSIGIAAAFSFYPGKNLGACGEAGSVVTNDPEIARTVRTLRDHGQDRKYFHRLVGWNARMDGIQGAVLSVKLKHLDDWNAARRNAAVSYLRLLAGRTEVALPREAEYARHVYHVFAIRAGDKDRLQKDLADRGIHCGVHYPVPIHLQQAYSHLVLPVGSFPVAELCSREFLSLPMYAELTQAQISYVTESICAISPQAAATTPRSRN